jgi:pimeloyl-ACP methyl ester carboxylesterase
MPYWHIEGRPLQPDPAVTLAVVAIHGHSRNGDWHTCLMHRALLQTFGTNVTSERVLLLGPQVDERAGGLLRDGTRKTMAGNAKQEQPLRPEGSFFWQSEEWKTGVDGMFDVMDAFFTALADANAFPALRAIVVVGHSAGAQLVQRFAIVGPSVEADLNRRNVHVRYVASAPSSFLYLGPLRPKGAPETLESNLCKPKTSSHGSIPNIAFNVPDEETSRVCPLYDKWPYGLGGRHPRVRHPCESWRPHVLAFSIREARFGDTHRG